MQNPDIFVHVSLPSGVHRVPRAVAERAGWEPLGETKPKRSPAAKPRVKKGTTRRKPRKAAAPKPRANPGAATPITPDPEATASVNPEEQA